MQLGSKVRNNVRSKYYDVRDKLNAQRYRMRQRIVATAPVPIYAEVPQGGQKAVSWPWLLGIPASFLAVVLIAFSGDISMWLRNRNLKKRSGRWVRDRSLGGKLIFVSTDDLDKPISPRARSSSLGDPEGEEAASSLRDMASAATPVSTTATRSMDAQTAAADDTTGAALTRPEWWTFTPPVIVSEAHRDACAQRAKRLVRQLEDGKVIRGQDYDPLLLVTLYQTCKVCPCTAELLLPLLLARSDGGCVVV